MVTECNSTSCREFRTFAFRRNVAILPHLPHLGGEGKIASKQAPFGSNGKLVGERVGAKLARRLVHDSHQDWSKLAGNLAPSPTKWGKWGKISRLFGNLAQIIPAHCTSKTKPSILML